MAAAEEARLGNAKSLWLPPHDWEAIGQTTRAVGTVGGAVSFGWIVYNSFDIPTKLQLPWVFLASASFALAAFGSGLIDGTHAKPAESRWPEGLSKWMIMGGIGTIAAPFAIAGLDHQFGGSRIGRLLFRYIVDLIESPFGGVSLMALGGISSFYGLGRWLGTSTMAPEHLQTTLPTRPPAEQSSEPLMISPPPSMGSGMVK